MQTQKAPGSNPEPSYIEGTMLSTLHKKPQTPSDLENKDKHYRSDFYSVCQ